MKKIKTREFYAQHVISYTTLKSSIYKICHGELISIFLNMGRLNFQTVTTPNKADIADNISVVLISLIMFSFVAVISNTIRVIQGKIVCYALLYSSD